MFTFTSLFIARRGIPGSPGHLVLRVHCPPSAPATIVSLPYDQQLYSYNLQDLYIDMQSGIFKVRSSLNKRLVNILVGNMKFFFN